MIEREKKSNNELIKKLDSKAKNKTKTWAHEYNKKELNNILTFLKNAEKFTGTINKMLKAADVNDSIDLNEVFKDSNNKRIELILNELIKNIEMELFRAKTKYEFPKEFNDRIDELIKEKRNNVFNKILWPETSLNVNSISDLEKYFKELEDSRDLANKRIQDYIKRTTEQFSKHKKEVRNEYLDLLNEMKKILHKQIDGKISDTFDINKESDQIGENESTPLQAFLRKEAKGILKLNGFEKFMKEEFNTNDPEGELIKQLR